MRALFAVLFGASVVLSLAFVAAIWPERRRDPGMFWFLVSLAGVAVAVDGWLFVVLLGTQLPAWLLAVALAVQDGVFGWRLWLALRLRLRQRFAIHESPEE